MRRILKRLRSDRADSELVSLLIMLPLVVGILFTMIDLSIYFSNRSLIQASARDAARTVAIMGGNGTATKGTPIENKYGAVKANMCAGLDSNTITKNAYNAASSVIECQTLQAYAQDKGLINVIINSVQCTPTVSLVLGTKTECTVVWVYGSIPGSAMSFVQLTKTNTSSGASESEVGFANGDTSGSINENNVLQTRPIV